MSISLRCWDFVAVWKKFWNDNYLFEVELLQHFLQLTKLSRALRCAGPDLDHGSPNYDPRSHFIWAQKNFHNNEKIIYFRKICWFGRSYHISKPITLRKVSGPRTCVTAYVALGQKSLETLIYTIKFVAFWRTAVLTVSVHAFYTCTEF